VCNEKYLERDCGKRGRKKKHIVAEREKKQEKENKLLHSIKSWR